MFLESRRTFLQRTFLTTVVVVMSGRELFGAVTPLETLSVVQDDLFPHANILEVNASAYIILIFSHTRVSDEDKDFLRNGVQWLNEESISIYKTIYTKLSPKQRQNVLQTISQRRWGENWIETVLTYIMEATLGDSIYGINKNGAGWRWLNHQSGLPRPKEALL